MGKLVKIDRFLAWVLFIGIALYFVTGFAMTKGIMNPVLSTKLHLNYLTYVILVAFVGHSAFAIHLALRRWNFWNFFSGTILILFYLVLIGGIFYIDKFYGKNTTPKPATSASTSVTATPTKNTTPTIKTFTLAELAKYNGQNGQRSYVAVDGNVYDLSAVFQNGRHVSHFAGTELTNAFYSYHAKFVLAKYPIVGKLVK